MIFKDGDNILTVLDTLPEFDAFVYIPDLWDWCKIWDVGWERQGESLLKILGVKNDLD